MGELKGTAEEIKADLLWVAQESLRSNLVHGTAGNFSARLPDGNRTELEAVRVGGLRPP